MEYKSRFIRQNKEDNKVILWIPGANDTFFHQEQLSKGLFDNYDIYLLHLGDFHPSDPKNETIPPAHTTENFHLYFPEFDRELETLQSNGYRDFYIYSHSTGCLLALEYSIHGRFKDSIQKIVFDDPFWDYNQPNPILKFFQKNILLYPLTWKWRPFCITFDKNQIISYNTTSKTKMHQKNQGYDVPFVYENNDYAGFAMACSKTMSLIQNSNSFLLDVPVLILIAQGNRMLNATDLKKHSRFISRNQKIKVIQECYHSCLMPDNKADLDIIIPDINKFINKSNMYAKCENVHNSTDLVQYHNQCIDITGYKIFF